ncbi:hypothetical protein BX661DRAFT_184609 [Kickxella alabastrina]|uniref:uncharacterized protein n=1 Tax=Kickxella alabastrina TaxID=61397 RepID=UPI00222092F8|nr:uncharacterized protein BX661DRAFT_184609 [Kickxella alabastrina]KAI7825455.1 hypothetical protein BX661DRAFT_184609 [Kickxella alabastrina]
MTTSNTVATLPEELYILVFKQLPGFRDVCECSRVCRQWRVFADSDPVWGALLRQNLVNTSDDDLCNHIDDSHARLPKHKRIFATWYQRYRGFTDSYTRMRRAVQKLEMWAHDHSPQLLRSLSPGLGWMGSESVPVRELLRVVSDSPAMRDFLMAYHMHDGQRRQERFLDFGLFGSYLCYGEFCSLSWLSSRMLQVVAMGQFKILVFAWCNATRNYLGILVDCPASCTQQILHHVVQLQPQSFRFVDKGLFGDFFSAYVDALADGHHDIDNGAICMMPNCGPNTSTSVSHGIRTTVSVMFCSDETSRFRVYRYQVTFEIVDPEELGFDSVQLKDRHWLVHYSDEQLAQSGGPGVIGQLPVLSRESPYYRYCSRMQDEEGGPAVVAFEGHFTMVPGTLEEPLGQDMILFVPYVEVPMPLEVL